MTEASKTKRTRKSVRLTNGALVTPSTSSAEAAPALMQKAPKKAAMVLDLLRRPNGASLDELVAATGWLPHTTRAALTGLRKKGHSIAKEKVDGLARYSIAESILA